MARQGLKKKQRRKRKQKMLQRAAEAKNKTEVKADIAVQDVQPLAV